MKTLLRKIPRIRSEYIRSTIFAAFFLPLFPIFSLVTDSGPSIAFIPLWRCIYFLTHSPALILFSTPMWIITVILFLILNRLLMPFLWKTFEIVKAQKEIFLKYNVYSSVIFILGITTISVVLVHFMSGYVGGTTNFSETQRKLYRYGEMTQILMPFFLLTLGFYYLNLYLFAYLFGLSQIPNILFDRIGNPESLTVAGIIIVTPLLITEWFLFSNIVINLIKRRKTWPADVV